MKSGITGLAGGMSIELGRVGAWRHPSGLTPSMTAPPSGIGAVALADLLGHWPAADGPLYRLLATRIARLAAARRLAALPAGR